MSLLADMHRMGPAPTRERELGAAAANLALALVASILLLVLWDAPVVAGALGLLLVAHVVVRLVLFARRQRREAEKSW